MFHKLKHLTKRSFNGPNKDAEIGREFDATDSILLQLNEMQTFINARNVMLKRIAHRVVMSMGGELVRIANSPQAEQDEIIKSMAFHDGGDLHKLVTLINASEEEVISVSKKLMETETYGLSYDFSELHKGLHRDN